MEQALAAAVARAIAQATGRPAQIAGANAAGGGCINDACTVALADGRRFFVKSNSSPPPGLFEREAEGLRALAAAAAIRVPAVIATCASSGRVPPFLVLEQIETGRPGDGFFARFGSELAALHRTATSDRFGFAHDNHIGATPQPNRWSDDWVEFWRTRRLGHQLALARRKGLTDPAFDRLGDALMARVGELIAGPAEPPTLLHGDLWGGNYLVDDTGAPVLCDPAAYYGRREADLAMTRLFGGFDQRFYAAYEEAWPLAPGSEERLELYELYHLLNHLNLFGPSYRAGCIAIMKRYA